MTDSERALLRQDEVEWERATNNAEFITFASIKELLRRLAAARAGEGWIAVTERLPTEADAKPYLMDTLQGKRELGVVLWLDRGKPVAAQVESVSSHFSSHWMPLPSPPAESLQPVAESETK